MFQDAMFMVMSDDLLIHCHDVWCCSISCVYITCLYILFMIKIYVFYSMSLYSYSMFRPRCTATEKQSPCRIVEVVVFRKPGEVVV